MGHLVEVPINPAVLRWAIAQSGLSPVEVAERAGASESDLRDWQKGDASPSLTEFRRLASVLRRQAAIFFLAAQPSKQGPTTSLRHPPNAPRDSLNEVERRYLREVSRTQEVLAWVSQQLHTTNVAVPELRTSVKPEIAAQKLRSEFNISTETQASWKDAPEAFRRWRTLLEDRGVFVFLFPMGKGSARGMSIWNEFAPAVALNTAWNTTARIYTLFHEVAHLVSRTDSACVGYANAFMIGNNLSIERWCERFSAAFLLPRDHLKVFLQKDLGWRGRKACTLEHAGKVARRYKVSLRASALALIEVGAAEKSLYAAIPSWSDEKSGGGGGRPRTRSEISEDRFGSRARSTFLRAVREDLITRADALSYLDIGEPDSAGNQTSS